MSPDTSDENLVRILRSAPNRRKDRALEMLHDRYRSRVQRTATRILGDLGLAMDVAQETFLKIFLHSDRFRFRSTVSSWIYRVTVNTALDRKRRRELRSALSLSRLPEGTEPGSGADGPSRSAELSEFRSALLRAVRDLDPAVRATVERRYIDGRSYEEIAREQRLAMGTVKSRLHRGRAALSGGLAAHV